MGWFGLGKKTDLYDEGYGDGQQYQAQQPGLDNPGFAQAQRSASVLNQQELGLTESQDAQWQAGFVDGYTGQEYGDSYMQSIDQFPVEAPDFSLWRFLGF